MTFARRTHWAKRAVLAPFSRTRIAGVQVLLTFDDGPHPEHTPAVLERLSTFGASAAFFLVGNRITEPALVEHVRGHGHAIGNHTFGHAVPRWCEVRASIEDVRRCQLLVPHATLFRPPLGKLTPGLWLAARRLGLGCMSWSLDSGDWRCRSAADAKRCADEVLKFVRPGDIILFHDDHRWIAPILDVVLPGLAARRLLPDIRSMARRSRT
ncbi:Peptidoglycan-N-acetylglucosamine deacetylase [Gemmata obscuriglobus]|nr:polysaccharide deacetylase family protein [Gemmata obscuriglobus]QEG27916.1 Peptidoglycan-N-acetylglucosamine deacetylase [Gemmata obscuriglobus]VTS05358.1 polysaccharide deacetylase : Polysaccharide deacetylase OS=Vibrio campbellii CAIM 519 = NBRC 15631 GN=B878_00190 PE=4 SV=1: Polysacc_deac_1 [Gemmata obscuriglobus UQM 2246]